VVTEQESTWGNSLNRLFATVESVHAIERESISARGRWHAYPLYPVATAQQMLNPANVASWRRWSDRDWRVALGGRAIAKLPSIVATPAIGDALRG
jgi:hypothetical protein